MAVTTRILPPDEWYPAAFPEARAHYLTLPAGERARVVEAGPLGGTVVVALHGWGASAYSFRRLLPLLDAAGMRAIALDLRGHGLSEKPMEPARYSAAGMARYVLDVLDVLGLESVVLVGQSMGGAIAIDTAVAAGARVRGVVLAAPVGFTAIRRIAVARAVRASRWISDRVPRWMIRVILRRVYGTIRPFEDRDIDEYWAPAQFRDWPHALFHLVNEFDWGMRPHDQLQAIGGNVFALFGERDNLIPAARAVFRAGVFAPERVLVVPGSGHLIAEEAPEFIVRAIEVALGTRR
jgi:pimeloyl-ACP methyl ester carboxylesterase